jgi:acyl-CoA synthetase (AMP-forming)/AMP-acid ligase II
MAAVYGDRTAFVLDAPVACRGASESVLSYRDLLDIVRRMAGAISQLGVRPGDRVALLTMNRIEMAFATFALGRMGAIPVPLHFHLSTDEIEVILQRVGAEVVLCDRVAFAGVVGQASRVPTAKRWAFVDDGPMPTGGVALWQQMPVACPATEPREPTSDTDVALVFFTSGTTGMPKGAALSHAATMVGPRHIAALSALRSTVPEHRALLVMPVAHVGGYAAMIHYLSLGWPIQFTSHFDPETILDTIERDRIAVFTGTPAMYRMLLDAGAADRDLRSIRVWGGGADAFPDALIRTFRDFTRRRDRFGRGRKAKFIRGYGMAETNSYVAQTPPFPAGDGCLGWVLPPVRYRIVDENHQDVAPGSAGELWLSGPSIMTGYWDDPEETDLALVDGWFRTGDVVRRGRWRMLYFVDRSRDIIKSGGYKVSAAEVDRVMTQHPAVEHAATVGLPDATTGERVVSVVTFRPGAAVAPEELKAWARRSLAPHKCPREVIVAESIPLTFTLKPKRREVRDSLVTGEAPAAVVARA